MAQLGVIADGISRDLTTALAVAQEAGLTEVELQYIGQTEVGDLAESQIMAVTSLLSARDLKVSCISRHVFSGLSVMDTERDGPVMGAHLAGLERCIDLAQQLQAPLVRIMSFRKEMILFGDHGAEEWVVSTGAWDRLLYLLEPAVQLADDRGQTLVVETGNTGMVNSAALGRRLLDDLGRPARLKVLWDPCNCLYAGEPAFPDGCRQLLGGYLGHIHIKDAHVRPVQGRVSCRPLGQGDMGPFLADMAQALAADGYVGSISLESIFKPAGGSFADGFRQSVDTMKTLFA